ncbi:hypothetical protein GCM10009854_29940 [Saccharopolyspora halophila]|uniref:ADP-ribosylglycohydrolase n=2 Tax=Saccharopolyspora halophila TaxID=405551 RepID=A0ABN3GF71_9PSEU
MQEQAKKQPNTWLYVVDPIFTDPNAEVPPWGFIGGYRVDEQGEITDDFSPNPNYRPSPVALRLPAPSNDVERALQLTTTGYAQGSALLTAMLDSELILFAQPQGSGLFTVEHESGRRQLQLFTSENFLPSNWTTWQRMTGRQLAGCGLSGIDLQVNPTSAVKARMPAEELVKIAHTVPPQPVGVPMSPPTGNPAAPPVPSAPASPPAGAPQQAAAGPQPVDTEFGRRFLGSVLAGAIGDALGAPVEFYPVDQIRSRFGADGVTEYDRSGEHPGEFTDDTQLAMFTLEGLIRGHIADPDNFPLPALQLAYQRWLHTQGYNWERAAGPFAAEHPQPTGWLIAQAELFAVRSPNSSCISALREFASAGAPGTFDRAINDAENCGGVVRAAPMALWSEDPREVFELAAAAAALTHSKPNGYLPAGVLAVLVHRLLHEEPLAKALEQARELLVGYRDHEETERVLEAAEELASRGKPTPEQLKDDLGGGWSGHEALGIAICAALSTDSVASALIIATNHSGDSDSTASICGNIVGAMYGATALPGVWVRDLKQRETLETLVKDALLQFGGAPPTGEAWTARYPGAKDVSSLDFTSVLPTADEPTGQSQSDGGTGTETTRVTTPVPPPPAEQEGTEIPEPQDSDSAPKPDDAEAAPQPVAAAAESVVQPPESAAPRPSSPADLHAQRIRGMLLGAAAGDALGYPIEADSLPEIRAKYGDSGLIDYVDAHHQGGSVSDETQLTLFATDGLIRASIARLQGGITDPTEQVGYAHLRWLHTQGFEWAEAGGPLATQRPDGHLVEHDELFVRRSPAATCLQALQAYAGGGEPGSLGNRVNEATDCGALVRVAPAAMWSDNPAEVFWAGAAIASLTHGHPDGHLPAGALAVLVQQLLANRSLPQAVERALLELSNWDGHEESTAALRKAVELAATGAPTSEQIENSFGDLRSGAQALAIAVCAALTHPESFPEAVVLAANHSGDSDSTAAVCGTVMGTAHTAAAIPQHWQDKIELAELITAVATDASKAFGPNPPEMQDRYPVNEPAEQQPEPMAVAQPEVAAEEPVDIVPQPEPDAEPAAMAELPDEVDAEPVLPQREPEPEAQPVGESEPDPEPEAVPEAETAVAQPAPEQEPEQAPASSPQEASAPHPAAEHEDSATPDSAEAKTEDPDLSSEELRLLAAWRKFRDNEEGNPSELTQGLHKLLVEAFGEQRAAQLIGEEVAAAPEPEEPAEDPRPQPSRQERLSGCVFGGAVGDALGAPWVFSDLLTTLRENPDGVREFAEHFGARGTATGITQQSAFLLSGLIGARLNSADRPTMVRNALRHWLHAQGARVTPPEPGDPLEGFTALHAQRFPDEATLTALARWGDRSENPTPSNPPNDARSASATARGAVVGFETTGHAEAISLGVEIGVLTHGHPDGYFPAAALAGLINALAAGQPLGAAIEAVLPELDRMEGAETTAQGLRSAVEVATAGPVSPTVLESLGLGFNAPEALAISVAAALSHPASFDDAVSLAATHAGNSAATAAICGALLGAERGIAEVPQERIEQLELREVLHRLIADAEGARGESEPDEPAPEWAERYAG